MKKLIALAGIIATFGLAACGETYDAVNGTDQVLVQDDQGDGKIDQENINRACSDKGQRVGDIAWVGNGKLAALVTCR